MADRAVIRRAPGALVLPLGYIETCKGRMRLGPAVAREIAVELQIRGSLPIDTEFMHREAAGACEVRFAAGVGLQADRLSFTARGRKMLAGKVPVYLSPCFMVADDGVTICGLVSLSLCRDPPFVGAVPLTRKRGCCGP